jgi:hypothetical protein
MQLLSWSRLNGAELKMTARRDPLAKAMELLAQISPTAEGQALRRLLRTLTTKDSTFGESDAYLFSAPALSFIAALIDARIAGTYKQEEWQRALGR